MKALFSEIRGALVSTVVLAVACCGFYPLAVSAISHVAFRSKADGSLIVDKNGVIRGSALLGQNFSGERYFHPRSSAAGTNGYDASSSGGSNLGPTSQKLADQIQARIVAYRSINGLSDSQPVPVDAVTASGSGVDPHISPANAHLQIARIAKARNLPSEKVQQLVELNSEKPDLGLFGDSRVNVLKLNLALDSLSLPSK